MLLFVNVNQFAVLLKKKCQPIDIQSCHFTPRYRPITEWTQRAVITWVDLCVVVMREKGLCSLVSTL